MMHRMAAIALAFAIPSFAATGQSATQPKQVASLCSVMTQSADYSDQRISIRGIVLSNDPKHLILMWPECQFGMHLVFTHESEGHADVKALYQAVTRGNPGRVDSDITRQFIGTFSYSKAGAVYELVVESVGPSPPYGN
jgi:hypothetical protein